LFQKLETFESNFLEKQIFSAKLQDLKQLRESIWLTVTQRKDISRNVLLTVNEFNSLDQKINGWVDEFLQYMDSHSQYTLIIPNYQSIDEQIVERTTELNVLKSRATYLQNQAGLGLFAEHRIGVAERRLGEAKHRRQLQEFRQVFLTFR
jgi:adenosyl cobinamide kinase/adenosyl cobinamide phosphate guanylyltransferase